MEERDIYLEQARQAWSHNDHDAAYAIYEKLLHQNSNDPKVLLEYGRAVYAEFDELEKATLLFERALAVKPDSIIALLYLGDLYSSGYGQGYRAALPIYQRVIELAPHTVKFCKEAYMGIGMLHHVPGSPVSYSEVIAAFRKATEIAPHCVNAHANLGMALYEGGDLQSAWNEFKIAEQLLKSNGQQLDYIQKILKHIENNEPCTYGGYTRSSIVNEWPQRHID